MLLEIGIFITGIVIGSIVSVYILFRKISSDLNDIMFISNYFEQVVEQLGKNQEYLDSVAYKDERVIRLMKRNASLIGQIRDEVERIEAKPDTNT